MSCCIIRFSRRVFNLLAATQRCSRTSWRSLQNEWENHMMKKCSRTELNAIDKNCARSSDARHASQKQPPTLSTCGRHQTWNSCCQHLPKTSNVQSEVKILHIVPGAMPPATWVNGYIQNKVSQNPNHMHNFVPLTASPWSRAQCNCDATQNWKRRY